MKPRLSLVTVLAATVAACGQPSMTPGQAHYEAQKILAAVNGKAGTAAFIDVVLRNDMQYDEIFTRGLRPLLTAAPVREPAFAPYMSCYQSADALMRFVELRRLGGSQNEQSDQYRRPYFDNLVACEAALSQPK